MPESPTDFDFTALTADERTLLAHRLWESVQHEIESKPLTAEQQAEIERRISEADAGCIASSPWQAVRQRLMSRQ